ncbi:MAG: LPS export ABC transporter permease LptG [Roseovarius sp.]
MILDGYLARRFAWHFGLVLAIFVVLRFLIDLIEELQHFSELPLREVLHIVLLNMPAANYEILPLVVVLASVALFVRLARSSELVVVRAAGRSALRSLLAPLAVAGLIGVLAVTMLNPVVAATAKRHNDLTNSLIGGDAAVLVIASEGLWLRQGGPDGQTVIHAERASSDLSVLFDTTFIDFDPDGRPAQRIAASAARLDPGGWTLYNVKQWDLAGNDNPEAGAVTRDELRLPTAMTRDRILDSFGRPEFIPIWELPQFIAQLDQAGFSARRYAMWYQMEIAGPVFLVALVMISAAFTMRHARLSNTGLSVLSAILLGFGMYYMRNFAQILGENGQIPILLAAWAPPVASLLLATGILLHMEDG